MTVAEREETPWRLGVHPGAKVYGIFTLRNTITRVVGLP